MQYFILDTVHFEAFHLDYDSSDTKSCSIFYTCIQLHSTPRELAILHRKATSFTAFAGGNVHDMTKVYIPVGFRASLQLASWPLLHSQACFSDRGLPIRGTILVHWHPPSWLMRYHRSNQMRNFQLSPEEWVEVGIKFYCEFTTSVDLSLTLNVSPKLSLWPLWPRFNGKF